MRQADPAAVHRPNMILFFIILAVVVIVGVLSFKAQMTGSADVKPGAGCAGMVLLAAAFCTMIVLLRESLGVDFMSLAVMLLIGAIVAVLYAPFISGVFASFFDSLVYPTGGGKLRSYDIAEKLVREARYTEAIAEYEKAIENDPEDLAPQIAIADMHCKMGQYDQAAQILLQVLDKDMPPETWCHTANRLVDIFAHKLGDAQKAVTILERIVQKYPDSTFAPYARERVARISKAL